MTEAQALIRDKVSTNVRPYLFESYGVSIALTSNDQAVIDRAASVCRNSLLNRLTELTDGPADHVFELPITKGGTMKLILDGERIIAGGRSKKKFYKFLDSMIRVTIGEFAVDHVFLHAGVVGWKGRAIIIPADSYKGKSSLVAAFVSLGADYFSDDFGIFDKDGFVHPFPRPLAMRTADHKAYMVSVESLGGKIGKGPMKPGLVLFTEYVPDMTFRPQLQTPGEGVMGMIPFALSIRQRSDLAFSVLNKIASHAIIASGLRGDSKTSAKTILNFVDKHVD